MVVALALLIVAFQIDLDTGESFAVQMQEQETVDVREITQTQQEERVPPPPRPPVPVEVPNNEIIEHETPNFDASLDLGEELDTSMPPPSTTHESEEEEEEEPEIFVLVEEKPELIGGIEALQQDVHYPEFAKKAGIQGRVIVQFVVDKNGDVQSATVVRGIHKMLNEAALEAIEKQRFIPGRQRDEPVKVKMSLPVTFRLHSGQKPLP